MDIFLVGAAMDIYQSLVKNLDTEGRYYLVNAICNQLRYPNNHTHYFSFVLLYLWAEASSVSTFLIFSCSVPGLLFYLANLHACPYKSCSIFPLGKREEFLLYPSKHRNITYLIKETVVQNRHSIVSSNVLTNMMKN